MPLILVDTFSPKKFLPVELTVDGMELVETTLGLRADNGALFVEIGDDVVSTPEAYRDLLTGAFPGLLEQAIDDECEYIQFYY